MSDLGHRLTDKELLKLERRIWSVYNDASKEMDKTVQDYFASFTARDQEMHQLVLDGKWDERKYKQWRLAQIGRGQRFEAMRDKLAAQATEANERAIAYVNSAMPNIYALNRNYAAYTIEQVSKAADFTLYDEGTVLRLLAENPATMPYYPQKRAIDRGIDLAYGQRQITATVTSGILRGNSIKKIADELQNYIVDMSRTSAIRSARTAVTSAQNGGRQASYDAAEKMGVVVQKEWMATLDARTRIEHGMADGQIVDKDKPFIVGGEELMFPGDTSAHGWNVYNCRCTMRAVIPGSPNQKRETYSEWKKRKEKENTDFTSERNPAIIDLPDIRIGKSVGAKRAADDILDLGTGERFNLADGTYIQNVQVFAGKGTKTDFRDADKYSERYGGKAEDWQHVKGIGILDTDEGYRKAILHWVQCEGIGRKEMFIKEWLE